MEWAGKPGLSNPLVAYQATTPYRIEKPFLFIRNEDQKLYLGIPKLHRNSLGVHHEAMNETERVPISVDKAQSKVAVFTPRDSIDAIQEAVHRGCHIVLNPGTYRWNKTLHIHCHNQVVLGIGMATIQAPNDGSPCIFVAPDAQGVRISGLSLEASDISIYEGSTLLQWGDPDNNTAGSAENPGAIHDLFCFVGGRSLVRTVSVETMVKIYANHVIGDNLWLWRADHVKLQPGEQPNKPELSEYHVTEYGECRCDRGLAVFGSHVTMYGLAVEHTYQDLVEWHGQHGAVYFYQSELPYDVPGSVFQNVVGYRVHKVADDHVAKGIGVYSYFRD